MYVFALKYEYDTNTINIQFDFIYWIVHFISILLFAFVFIAVLRLLFLHFIIIFMYKYIGTEIQNVPSNLIYNESAAIREKKTNRSQKKIIWFKLSINLIWRCGSVNISIYIYWDLLLWMCNRVF